MARNMIKCVLTGEERITNNSYLGKKADRLGISVETFRQYYISKGGLQAVRALVDNVGYVEAASNLDGKWTATEVRTMLVQNGKNSQLLSKADSEAATSVPVSVGDPVLELDYATLPTNTTTDTTLVSEGAGN